ncbi:MAG: hypothetical protein QNL68_11240 [Akkermansiaceae bacterium]
MSSTSKSDRLLVSTSSTPHSEWNIASPAHASLSYYRSVDRCWDRNDQWDKPGTSA